MPMMPFIGVRISWLTVARKRDLAWLADSARSRALISAVSARLRAVMSRAIARWETASLALSRTDSSIHENQRSPCGVRIATSVELRHSPSEKAASGTMPTSMPSSARVRPAELAGLRSRPDRRTPCWRRRCGPHGRDGRQDRRARRSGRETAPRFPAAPTCGRRASRTRRGSWPPYRASARHADARHAEESATAAIPIPPAAAIAAAIRAGAPVR